MVEAQNRLEFNDLSAAQLALLSETFGNEIHTKHGFSKVYPNVSGDALAEKLNVFNNQHKMSYTHTFLMSDFSAYGFSSYVEGVKIPDELEDRDFYKIKESFAMGEYFEFIDDTHPRFIPALVDGFINYMESILDLELIEVNGNVMQFKLNDFDDTLFLTYSPTSKTVLFQLGVEQAVSPQINDSVGYETLCDYIENELLEGFF